MTARIPSLDEVLMLPAALKATVTPDFIDINGHMNVRHYLDLNVNGTLVLIERVGVDDAYRAERRMGLFTVEHHLRYFSELHLGEEVSVHPTVLARSGKAVHMMAYLVDATHGRLANTLELVIVHVDMDTRRPVAMPDDVAAGFDELIEVEERLPWTAPTCGAMGIRAWATQVRDRPPPEAAGRERAG